MAAEVVIAMKVVYNNQLFIPSNDDNSVQGWGHTKAYGNLFNGGGGKQCQQFIQTATANTNATAAAATYQLTFYSIQGKLIFCTDLSSLHFHLYRV